MTNKPQHSGVYMVWLQWIPKNVLLPPRSLFYHSGVDTWYAAKGNTGNYLLDEDGAPEFEVLRFWGPFPELGLNQGVVENPFCPQTLGRVLRETGLGLVKTSNTQKNVGLSPESALVCALTGLPQMSQRQGIRSGKLDVLMGVPVLKEDEDQQLCQHLGCKSMGTPFVMEETYGKRLKSYVCDQHRPEWERYGCPVGTALWAAGPGPRAMTVFTEGNSMKLVKNEKPPMETWVEIRRASNPLVKLRARMFPASPASSPKDGVFWWGVPDGGLNSGWYVVDPSDEWRLSGEPMRSPKCMEQGCDCQTTERYLLILDSGTYAAYLCQTHGPVWAASGYVKG